MVLTDFSIKSFNNYEMGFEFPPPYVVIIFISNLDKNVKQKRQKKAE
jgi:hypothetical protein